MSPSTGMIRLFCAVCRSFFVLKRQFSRFSTILIAVTAICATMVYSEVNPGGACGIQLLQSFHGISGLDEILRGLLPGDNIVWQVNSIEEYRYYVDFYAHAAENARSISCTSASPVMNRWYGKRTFLPCGSTNSTPKTGSNLHNRHPFGHQQNGRGGNYILILSVSFRNLVFRPYAREFFHAHLSLSPGHGSAGLFRVMRQEHSDNALSPIHNTAQVILDVYTHEGTRISIRSLQQRHSRTMHMLHREEGELPILR